MNTPTDNQQALVQARLKARARRISMLRRRVVVGALASFVLAWGVIAGTGSLGANTTTTAGSQVTASTNVSSSDDDSSASFGGDDDTTAAANTANASSSTTSAPAPVTTSQS